MVADFNYMRKIARTSIDTTVDQQRKQRKRYIIGVVHGVDLKISLFAPPPGKAFLFLANNMPLEK